MKIGFNYRQMSQWCVFYCREGYSWRSLAGHMTAFRHAADAWGLKWHRKDSSSMRAMGRLMRGLRKAHPQAVNRATPLTKRWLALMLRQLGISSLADWWSCAPAQLVAGSRMLAAHTAMMRMCEHADGMRVDSVKEVDGSVVLMVPEIKDKLRTGQLRACGMALRSHWLSPGYALTVLKARLHSSSARSAVLFAKCVNGRATSTPASAAGFKKMLKQLAKSSDMAADKLRKVRGHSLRAGGATDFLSHGASRAWVQRQGGWRSDCFMIYYRPVSADMVAMSDQLKILEHKMASAAGG
jgi:hypothetical protein